jgi:Protein of unknown function (DUF1822)
MSIFDRHTESLSKIYPQHVWLDITDLAASLTDVELNQSWIERIGKYLTDMGLVVKSIFPSEELYLPLISKVVDGFVLSISDIKVAFIPSENLDLAGFEIQQEWVTLSNWAADYYVPIQVDREHNYLHLWGFISHQSIQQKAALDPILHSYEIDSADLIEDLDNLWMSCELAADFELGSRGEIPQLASLSASAIQTAIEQLRQHQSVFSPRLLLPFEQWGAIMNAPEYLSMYASPVPTITKIANWFRSQVTAVESISDTILSQGWLTIEQICKQPQLLPGYYHNHNQKDILALRGVNLGTQEIDRTVKNLYANQNLDRKVDLPPDIDSPIVLLVYLIQHTLDQTLRWQAAEYLWKLEPENSHNWHRRIKDLGLVMQGHKLGLMVAAIPLIDGTYAILNRVYPIGKEDYLPPSVELDLLSESGDRLYRVESRSTVMDSYIQLYFIASAGDIFNVRISMGNNSITEAFII